MKEQDEDVPDYEAVTFTIDGNSISFHGCNIVFGSYTLVGHAFEAQESWGSTLKLCPKDNDRQILAAVKKSNEARANGNAVTLSQNGRRELVLKKE